MSYSIMCYAIDLVKLKQACGSNDSSLAQLVMQQFSSQIMELDESFQDLYDEPPPSMEQIITQLIGGNVDINGIAGEKYGYALEMICEAIGAVPLPNDQFCPIRASWFYDSIPLTVQTLVHSGSPVPLPKIDEMPSIGFKSRDSIRKELAEQTSYAGVDEEVASAIAQYYDWLAYARDNNCDLIAFFY